MFGCCTDKKAKESFKESKTDTHLNCTKESKNDDNNPEESKTNLQHYQENVIPKDNSLRQDEQQQFQGVNQQKKGITQENQKDQLIPENEIGNHTDNLKNIDNHKSSYNQNNNDANILQSNNIQPTTGITQKSQVQSEVLNEILNEIKKQNSNYSEVKQVTTNLQNIIKMINPIIEHQQTDSKSNLNVEEHKKEESNEPIPERSSSETISLIPLINSKISNFINQDALKQIDLFGTSQLSITSFMAKESSRCLVDTAYRILKDNKRTDIIPNDAGDFALWYTIDMNGIIKMKFSQNSYSGVLFASIQIDSEQKVQRLQMMKKLEKYKEKYGITSKTDLSIRDIENDTLHFYTLRLATKI